MNIVDLNGWHTASAITYVDVNAAIAAGGQKPAGFTVAAPDNSASVTGTFGPWALTLGGAGPDIAMSIALTGGTVTGPFGAGGAQATLPLAACVFPVMLLATFVPHTATMLNLRVNGTAPVTVGSYQGTPPTSSFLANAVLQELLQQWLTTNINLFNVVFASVDLDAQYENDGLSWLAPSYHGYAVSEPASAPSLENSVFAILTLVDKAPAPTNLSYAVSPFAIPAGARAAFLIAGEKFLEHMMIAALPAMFQDLAPGSAMQHFAIDNAGTRIINTTDLRLQDVKLDNGNVVNPAVNTNNFTLQLDGTELVLSIMDMTFDMSAGIGIHLTYEGRSTLHYNKTNGILDLTVTTQTGSGSVEVSKGLQIAEYVLGAVAAASALVSGLGGLVAKSASAAVDGSAAAISAAEQVGEDEEVAQAATCSALGGMITRSPAEMSQLAARSLAICRVGMIAGFVSGLMPSIVTIMKAVAEGKYQGLPKITDLTSAAIGKTVIWPPVVGQLVLDSAQLVGALQFGLVTTPPPAPGAATGPGA